LSAQKASR